MTRTSGGGKIQRALEYEIIPMNREETGQLMSEYNSDSEIPYLLAYGTLGNENCIVYNPHVQFPFAIWYKGKDDVYWGCYHVMVSFHNNTAGYDNDTLTKMLNSRDGKTYFLGELMNEFKIKAQERQLTFEESKFYDVLKDRYTNIGEYFVKILPLVMNLPRDSIFEHRTGRRVEELRDTVKFTLDKRFLYEDTSYKWAGFAGTGLHNVTNAHIQTDLYSFAVWYEADKSIWFYNIFWDDYISEDTDEYIDKLLTDETGEEWKNFLSYNAHSPEYITEMASKKQGRLLGAYPVYIDTAVILDTKVLNLNYESSRN